MKPLARANTVQVILSALVVALLLPAARLRAEVFVLKGGGQIEGMLVNPTERPRERYLIRTSIGDVTLSRDQVKEVHKPKANQAAYHKLRPQFADTADGQWSLAEWCKEHKLTAERQVHMERIIQLEPGHLKARQALGYSFVEGQWKTRDEIHRERGLEKDAAGKWRPPQQIKDLAAQAEQKKAEQEWIAKVRRWRGWLNGDKAPEALPLFAAIDDPNAVPALINYMKNEKDAAVRRLYVETMARLGTNDVAHALGNYAMDDDDDEVRAASLDYLAKAEHPGAVDFFIKRLLHKDNVMVNRAGVALGKMKDPRAIRPLIDALVTRHKYQVTQGNGNNMNSTFGGAGGGNFGFGGGGPQIIEQDKQNPEVFAALTSLTGANFDYNEQAWRAWLTSQKKTQNVDARRD